MDEIKFANGAVYNCPFLATLPREGIAYVAVAGVTFAEAAAIFSDPALTERIEWGDYILHNYTDLVYVKTESYGYKACLRGGYDEHNEEASAE